LQLCLLFFSLLHGALLPACVCGRVAKTLTSFVHRGILRRCPAP
jgi:hypothetical protein